MKTNVALHRIRLELDRSLRGRAFFARAIRGDLGAVAYGDLIAELAALATAPASPLGDPLGALAAEDLERLRGVEAPSAPRCPATQQLHALGAAYGERLLPEDAHDVSIALLGSSWCREAVLRLGRRHGGAVRFLEELGRLGPVAFAALAGRLDAGRSEPRHVCTFAELARGACLGVATYLDLIWPAPVVTGAFSMPN